MNIAKQINRLGTETAFAVAKRAAQHAALGHTIYPLHLGDLNIPTADHIIEATLRAMRDGKTGYCANAGITPLREALAVNINAVRGTQYTMDNVSVQPGGKSLIGKFLMALMNPGDGVLCPSPGYPIYASQIEYHGGVIVPYGFVNDGKAFSIDFEALEKAVTPTTRLMIINDFHNPTGAACTAEERRRLAAFICKHDLYVLLDEAYLELQFDELGKSIVMEDGMLERAIILYTFSKKYAMTGWRLGAAFGPKSVIEVINRLNVNDESCTNHFIQYGALAALTGPQEGAQQMLRTMRARRDIGFTLLNQCSGVRCTNPAAGFYLFPDVTELMQKKGFAFDYEAFAEDVLIQTGMAFCTRVHFGTPMPDEKRAYIRIAFSGVEASVLETALQTFIAYAAE